MLYVCDDLKVERQCMMSGNKNIRSLPYDKSNYENQHHGYSSNNASNYDNRSILCGNKQQIWFYRQVLFVWADKWHHLSKSSLLLGMLHIYRALEQWKKSCNCGTPNLCIVICHAANLHNCSATFNAHQAKLSYIVFIVKRAQLVIKYVIVRRHRRTAFALLWRLL